MKFADDEEKTSGAPVWVVTFADLMSLLLVFFVMLLSFSEIDASKYRSLSESLREAFGAQKVQDVFTSSQPNQMLIAEQSGGTQSEILDQLRSIIPQAFPGALPDEHDARGFLLRVPGSLLFETGRDELKEAMKVPLRQVAELIRQQDGLTLRVDGHTDDVPIRNERFPSNWELSAGRALAVVHFLIDECGMAPSIVSAAAFADSRPITLNDTPANRELNRRVEFRFVHEKWGAEDGYRDAAFTE